MTGKVVHKVFTSELAGNLLAYRQRDSETRESEGTRELIASRLPSYLCLFNSFAVAVLICRTETRHALCQVCGQVRKRRRFFPWMGAKSHLRCMDAHESNAITAPCYLSKLV